MGMDVYGRNPKQNKTMEDFPTMKKYDAMEFSDKWKILDKDEKLRDQYFLEKDQYEDANPGFYFRENVWWWRPLWNYCYDVAPDLINEKTFTDGHSNSGAGLGNYKSQRLGQRLLEEIESGRTIKYQAEYIQWQDDLPPDTCTRCNANNRGNRKMKDCNVCDGKGEKESWDKHYPFDVDVVKRFAEFCIQSGGFEIC